MTNEAQPFVDTYVNIFGSTMSGSYAAPLNPRNFREHPLPRTNKYAGLAMPWEFTHDEFRGLQAQKEKMERSYAGWSSTTADRRFPGYLINPTLNTRESQVFGGTAGNGPVVWCDTGTNMIVAQGATANRCLATALVSVSPAPLYVTYAPGSAITALMSGPIGGATTANKVLIGRTSATIDVHTTLGTSDGTMHANLTFCCGGALSPINATTPGTPTWLFLANNGIWSLPVTAAITDAPTQTSYNLPNGGAVLGFEVLAKSPSGNRMYMLLPVAHNRTTSVWNTAGGAPAPCQLWSCNAEGTDMQEHKLPLSGIYFARLWQRKVVVSDGARVLAFDGETAADLTIFAAPATGAKMLVTGLGGDDSSLLADVARQFWEFNESGGGWTPASAQNAAISTSSVSDTGPYAINVITTMLGPNMPYSRYSATAWRPVYNTSEVTWDRQILQPRGINPALVGSTTESSGVDTSPAWTLPGMHAGHPFIIEEIDARQADIDLGGTGASLKCEVAGQEDNTSLSFTNSINYTFLKASAIAGRRQPFPGNRTMANRLQIKTTLTSGTTTPNGANVVYRGITLLDPSLYGKSAGQIRSGT